MIELSLIRNVALLKKCILKRILQKITLKQNRYNRNRYLVLQMQIEHYVF